MTRTMPTRSSRRILTASALLIGVTLVLSACSLPFAALFNQANPNTPSEVPSTIEQYYAQRPDWTSCAEGIECADVYAPLDWRNVSDQNPVTLRMTRHAATGSERLGSVFINPGGPGASGAEFVANSVDRAASAKLQEYYDVIGWDPRGVGASSSVACYDAAGTDEYLFGIAQSEPRTDEWIAEAQRSAAAFGDACVEETGRLLAYVDTVSTARDLDMLRAIVEDPTLNYIGYSYGTRIGAYYAELFPERVGRMVLDGVVNPAATVFDIVLFQTKGFEQAFESYLEWCISGSDCPFPGNVSDAQRSVETLLAKVEADPLPGEDGRMLGTNTLLTAIIYPLYDEGSWTYLNDLFAGLRTGDTRMAFALADAYYSRDSSGEYLDNSNEAFAAINCLDYARETDLDVMRQNAATIAQEAPLFGKYQGFGEIGCAEWPVLAKPFTKPVTAAGSPPILVIGTTGDPATPYQWSVNLANSLENGVLVTYNGEGHTAYNRSPANECVLNTVDDFMIRGTVPSGDPQC